MLKSWKELCELDIAKYVKQRDKADYLPWASCLKRSNSTPRTKRPAKRSRRKTSSGPSAR